MKQLTTKLGEQKISKLLINLSVPATIGMMVNALYNLVDTIFVGRGVGGLSHRRINHSLSHSNGHYGFRPDDRHRSSFRHIQKPGSKGYRKSRLYCRKFLFAYSYTKFNNCRYRPYLYRTDAKTFRCNRYYFTLCQRLYYYNTVG